MPIAKPMEGKTLIKMCTCDQDCGMICIQSSLSRVCFTRWALLNGRTDPSNDFGRFQHRRGLATTHKAAAQRTLRRLRFGKAFLMLGYPPNAVREHSIAPGLLL